MKLAKKQTKYAYQQRVVRNRSVTSTIHVKKKRTVKRIPLISRMLSVSLMSLFAFNVSPYAYDKTIKPIINSFKHKTVGSTLDYNYLYNKSSYTIHNDSIAGQRILAKNPIKAIMNSIYETEEIKPLKAQIENLLASYPSLNASVYVWDYKSGKYVDIDANRSFSAASIIKIPVLLELFRSIELGQLSLKDKFILTDVFRASGSGDLQYKQENSIYTVDELARMMMRDSDNSATNILMYLTGGSLNVNRSLRNWGMKISNVTNWLPDLEGDNKTTAREMATMLFNIENPNFLSLSSREYIFDYLSDIRNNRLLKAGLPNDALLIHKTGDIGKMLGDAGIVYAPSGEKYVVVILVDRPYNSPQGKDFIVKSSQMVYEYITKKL